MKKNSVGVIKSVLTDDERFKKRPLFFYGAGAICKKLLSVSEFIGVEPNYIVDSNPNLWGTELYGIKIISPSEMQKFDSDCPVVITTLFLAEVYKMLNEYGFDNIWRFPNMHDYVEHYYKIDNDKINIRCSEHSEDTAFIISNFADRCSKDVYESIIAKRCAGINNFEDIMDMDEYFCHDIISFGKNEVFLDGGGYGGETTLQFIKETGDMFDRSYIFEPEPGQAMNIKNNIESHPMKDKIVVVNKAIGDVSKSVRFTTGLNVSCHIDDSHGDVEVQMESIDNFFKDKDAPTYIKLDIEGAEMMALKGARETIQKHKPKLAVCLYHKFEDLWEIPLYLMKEYPFYKFYVRHHYISTLGTVLYAIPK